MITPHVTAFHTARPTRESATEYSWKHTRPPGASRSKTWSRHSSGIRHVSDAVGHQDPVEGSLDARLARQHGVPLDEAYPVGDRLLARPGEHAGRGVERHDRRRRIHGREGFGRQARAAAQIEHARTLGEGEALRAHAQVAPVAGVGPGEHVVARRHPVEVLRHLSPAFPLRRLVHAAGPPAVLRCAPHKRRTSPLDREPLPQRAVASTRNRTASSGGRPRPRPAAVQRPAPSAR